MKKLSKMVLLLGSVFLLTLFASCSNGSSSDSNDSREPDTLLAGKSYGSLYFNYPEMLCFKADGKSFEKIDTDTGMQTCEGTYVVADGEKQAERDVYLEYVYEGSVYNWNLKIPAGNDGWYDKDTVLKLEDTIVDCAYGLMVLD